MEHASKVIEKKNNVITRNTFDVITDFQFDKQDKVLEIELIDNNIKLIKQKLKLGAKTLQNNTISQLMSMLEELLLKKDFLENNKAIIYQASNIEEDPALHLHKKSQSGFELKVNIP